MEFEQGDTYLANLASFVRSNEKSLAEGGLARRRRGQPPAPDPLSALNPFTWFASDSNNVPHPKPLTLSIDTHHLFYILMRLEALGIDVGTLDVKVDSPSRPVSYINVFPDSDKSETLSLASFRSSLSVVSGLSLGGGWWGRSEPPTIDAELKYLYSCFTKLPALVVTAPGPKIISELATEAPNENAIPLDAFKNIQSLDCSNIDPRILLGWDRLAETLRSLRITKSGLEDVSDIFIGAVVDDQARRNGSASRKRRRRIPSGSSRQFHSSLTPIRLFNTVPESSDEDLLDSPDGSSSPPPSVQLSPSKWSQLQYLSLSDNSLTFIPIDSMPFLTSLTHLDLSSNLLVSVPPGLGSLYNLVSLNLSDNMIDSVLGIYLNMGQVLTLNLSRNRLESICGLERLHALERVDLRNNHIEESGEVGRLATLPNIAEVWVDGNPFTELEPSYRTFCFDFFWKEGKTVVLDGRPPGFYERRSLTTSPPQQMTSSRPQSVAASSPPVVAVGYLHAPPLPPSSPIKPDGRETPPSLSSSPYLVPANGSGPSQARRKKLKRIVDLDGDHSDTSSRSIIHSRTRTQESKIAKSRVEVSSPADDLPSVAPSSSGDGEQTLHREVEPQILPLRNPPLRIRHSRYQTEFPTNLQSAEVQPLHDKVGFLVGSGEEPWNTPRGKQRSATLLSRSAKRRSRMSASMFEGASDGEREVSMEGATDSAEAYRKRIEALKKDMGDGWLKVYSQSQLTSGGTTSTTKT